MLEAAARPHARRHRAGAGAGRGARRRGGGVDATPLPADRAARAGGDTELRSRVFSSVGDARAAEAEARPAPSTARLANWRILRATGTL